MLLKLSTRRTAIIKIRKLSTNLIIKSIRKLLGRILTIEKVLFGRKSEKTYQESI